MSSSAIRTAKAPGALAPLSAIPLREISKILFHLSGEPNVVTLSQPLAIETFCLGHERLPLEYRSEYSAWTMTAGASDVYRTVMVYTVDAEPHSLVVDLNDVRQMQFNARFVAGPFASEELAEKYAVDLLVQHGFAKRRDDGRIAFVDDGIESTDESEIYETDSGFLEAFQSGLAGLEWFHVFPAISPGVD